MMNDVEGAATELPNTMQKPADGVQPAISASASPDNFRGFVIIGQCNPFPVGPS